MAKKLILERADILEEETLLIKLEKDLIQAKPKILKCLFMHTYILVKNLQLIVQDFVSRLQY